MATEQKARATYEYLIDMADDPDVIEPLKFLRAREVVHFQRFGEALRTVQDKLAERKFYMSPCGCGGCGCGGCGGCGRNNGGCGCGF